MRRCEVFLLLLWAPATLPFSIHVIGAKLFLVYVYESSRVQEEQLRILSMPKTAP
jgi:hypothetical protein